MSTVNTNFIITLKAPITNFACFVISCYVLEASAINNEEPDQTAPVGEAWTGSTLFASILNKSILLGNYLQQTTTADNIFRYIFCWI